MGPRPWASRLSGQGELPGGEQIPVNSSTFYIRIPGCDCLKRKWYLLPLYYPLQVLRGYLVAVLNVYFSIPVMDCYWGLKSIFFNDEYKEEKSIHDTMPALKLFEQIGEGVPQLALAISFYATYGRQLTPNQLIFGYVTMALSAGSVLIGIVNGIRMELKYRIFSFYVCRNE